MEEPAEEVLETLEEAETVETVAAVESIEPEAEPEQVTESIDEPVAPETTIEPKDSYVEWDCRRFSRYSWSASDDINIKIEKTALGMELYRERFSFFDLTGNWELKNSLPNQMQ